jgi:hypothetical protein
MGDHGLVAITIRVQGGTHFLSYCVTDSLLYGSNIPGIGGPRHGLHHGRRGHRHAALDLQDTDGDGPKPGSIRQRSERRGIL